MDSRTRVRAGEWALLILLGLSVLWKGGKGLEATWLFAGVISLIILGSWLKSSGFPGSSRIHDDKTDASPHRGELPLPLWAGVHVFALWTVLSFIFSETRNYGFGELLRSATC